MRRDIQLDCRWFSLQKEIQNKFLDQDVLEDRVLEMQSTYGKVRAKFDDFQKRFLVLIATNKVEDIYLAELLNEIFAILIVQEEYIKFFKDELVVQAFFKVEQKIKEKEQFLNQNFHSNQAPPNLFKYIQQYQKLQNSNDFEMDRGEREQSNISSNRQIIFKGFTIFDAFRQCFYMLIKRGFANDNTWKMQRIKIQQYLLQKRQNPLQHFFLNSEMGQFLFEYDIQAKSYFILLTNSTSAQHPQDQLLSKLKALVLRIPNYHKVCKPELENKLKSSLLGVIEAEERIYYQKYYSDQAEKEKRKILKQREMTEHVFQNQRIMHFDENSLTDYNQSYHDKFISIIQ